MVRNLDHLSPFLIDNPVMKSLMDDDFIGAYELTLEGSKLSFLVLVSIHDGEWEHVSVSTEFRCPRWDEMNQIKDLFFREDEAVMQLHPPKAVYVNSHPFCLHLWRPIHAAIPLPDVSIV